MDIKTIDGDLRPFFSVIIPTYNRAKMVVKAINSVQHQTYSDWELIVVDDGSTDNTKETIEIINDNRIKYIYQKNAERSAARNNGIANAKGNYICFLDSDDYFLPTRLEGLKRFIDECSEKHALFYTAIIFDKDGVLKERTEVKRGSNTVFDFVTNAIIGTPQTCIHKALLESNLFNPSFRIGEDMELWLRIVDKNELIFIPNQATVIATDHIDRTANFKQNNTGIEELKTLKHCFSNQHSGGKISNKIKLEKISGCLFRAAIYHIYNHNRKMAIYYTFLSLINDLTSRQFLFRLNVLGRLVTFVNLEKVEKLVYYD